jgi:hypothetical protein
MKNAKQATLDGWFSGRGMKSSVTGTGAPKV